jgi:hypothetical protein
VAPKGFDAVTYFVDTNSLMVLRSYFPDRFPSVWENIRGLISEGRFLSVKEVLNELERHDSKHVLAWAKKNSSIFLQPTVSETACVVSIFAVPHFQQLIGAEQRLRGTPVADPFLVAAAKVHGGCVVTEEGFKKNAAKIPNVCRHFVVDYTNLEGLMERENWAF